MLRHTLLNVNKKMPFIHGALLESLYNEFNSEAQQKQPFSSGAWCFDEIFEKT